MRLTVSKQLAGEWDEFHADSCFRAVVVGEQGWCDKIRNGELDACALDGRDTGAWRLK